MLFPTALMDRHLWMRGVSLALLVVAFQVLVSRVSLKREAKRRLQHALTGHALVQISYVLPREMAFALLVLGAASIYILHQFYPALFQQAVGDLLRPNELTDLPGAFWFLLGTAVTVLVVKDWTIIRYAVECLALSDPMASWVGSTIRSPKINSRSSVSGCLGCFATAVVVGKVMLSNPSGYTIGIGAFVCMIAEASPYGNDNLNIPVLTALAVDHFGG